MCVGGCTTLYGYIYFRKYLPAVFGLININFSVHRYEYIHICIDIYILTQEIIKELVLTIIIQGTLDEIKIYLARTSLIILKVNLP